MKKLLYILGATLAFTGMSQQLSEATSSFTFKFDSYVTLKDDTELVGAVGDMDKQAGIVKTMMFRVEGEKKRKLKPEAMASMYLTPCYD